MKAAKLQVPCANTREYMHTHTHTLTHAFTPCSDLLQATLCPIQERNEEAAAAALIQGVCVAGQSLAYVLREGTGGQLRGHQGLLGQRPAFTVPPRLQDTVTQPVHCSVGTGGWGGLACMGDFSVGLGTVTRAHNPIRGPHKCFHFF